MNVFLHELWSYRKSTLLWALGLSAVTALLLLAIYPAFTKDIAASKKVLGGLPPALRNALGISLKDFFTIFGFFGYLFTFVALAGAIQAMNLGIGAISKEDSNKTADFLLTKPISRSAVVTGKLLAAVCSLIITNLIFMASAFLAATAATTESFSPQTFFLITATLFLMQLMFLALGAVFSVVIPKIKSVIAVSLPTIFAFFIISTLGSILGNQNVRYITPFKFYDITYIINNNSYEPKFLVIEAVFMVLATIATYVIYNRKDIRAA